MPQRHASTRPALVLAFVCFLLCGAAHARAQVPPPASPLPSPTGYVNDYANVIEPQAKARLEAILTNLNERGNVEFAVVTVPSLGGRDVFDYSLQVMRGWGIGSKEKGGVLLLFSLEERKGFVQVSRHLEGDLPDSTVGSIARQHMREPFRQGNYSEGLLRGVMAFVATLAEKRGFSVEGIDPGMAYREPARTQRERRTRRPQSGFSFCGVGLILLVVLLFIFASGRRGGGGGGGCLNLLLFNALLNAASSGGRSSGWGGGSFGGGGGWGGGGFGGFSGGGGDAGGGGAGFDW